MTLLLMEGYDHFTDYGSLKAWGYFDSGHGFGSVCQTAAVGRLGGRYMDVGSSHTSGQSGCYHRKFFPSTTTKGVWGFAFMLPANPLSSTFPQFAMVTSGGTAILQIVYNTATGKLDLVGLGLTVPLPITIASWIYIEIKAFVNGASSTVEVRMNGGPSLASTTCNLGSTPIGGVWVQGHKPSTGLSQNQHTYVDDMYFVDCNTGAAPLNDFLGDSTISTLLPSAAGAVTQWTPLAGANYAAVDEVPADGDTTYVESSTPGQIDTYTMPNIALVPNVYAIQFNLTAKKSDAGTREIAPVMRQGGSNYVGATKTLSTSYLDYTEIIPINPATGVAWTAAEVNADEFGVKVVT